MNEDKDFIVSQCLRRYDHEFGRRAELRGREMSYITFTLVLIFFWLELWKNHGIAGYTEFFFWVAVVDFLFCFFFFAVPYLSKNHTAHIGSPEKWEDFMEENPLDVVVKQLIHLHSTVSQANYEFNKTATAYLNKFRVFILQEILVFVVALITVVL